MNDGAPAIRGDADKGGPGLKKGQLAQVSAFSGCGLLVSVLMVVLGPNPAWAKRTVKGTITTMTAKPAGGVLVKAWDEDDVGKDDLMGKATTDSQGRYSIKYKGKHWDDAPHGITTWRPDIFIAVYAKIRGKWVRVKKSKTYDNHKLRRDKTINLQLTGIQGTITDHKGRPAGGILVKAWDEDDVLGGGHDFLNEATTDSQGRYEIMYEGKHWDGAPHGVTTWRPDIFIDVFSRAGSDRVRRSRTHEDWKIRKDLTINSRLPSPIPEAGPGSLNLLAYNIYMRPTSLFKNGQSIRAGLLPRQLQGYDVIVFSEAFDDDVRKDLLRRLRPSYPHTTKILGSDRGVEQDGGVIIVSKWPIEQEDQRLFKDVSKGDDRKADKGVLYARINKEGRRYHIFGSHTQATPGSKYASVRYKQFKIIKKFIDGKKIPAGEPVIIAGDLNVDKTRYPSEYESMLNILKAKHPSTRGHPYTFDPKTNKLADGRREFLDYVLYSKEHLRARQAYNEVRIICSHKDWREYFFEGSYWDLSDHYPVFGRLVFRLPRAKKKASKFRDRPLRRP